jgi:hypothetical protein
MDDMHMWLVPYTPGADHILTITFPGETEIAALRVWNYNKSSEDTWRGVRWKENRVPTGCVLTE